MIETDIRELNERIQRESQFIDLINLEMSKVIVGQKHMTERLLIGLLSNGHILLEGVPGLAKTLAIKTLSSIIDADFSRIQLRNCSSGMYTLFCAAKDLYFGTDRLILGDLADVEVVSPKIFRMVCNAMAICRVGLDVIRPKERKDD